MVSRRSRTRGDRQLKERFQFACGKQSQVPNFVGNTLSCALRSATHTCRCFMIESASSRLQLPVSAIACWRFDDDHPLDNRSQGNSFYFPHDRPTPPTDADRQHLEQAHVAAEVNGTRLLRERNRRSCPVAWCRWRRVTATAGLVRAGQLANAGRLTAGSSPIGAMVSSVI
jgi:hypothetical protein